MYLPEHPAQAEKLLSSVIVPTICFNVFLPLYFSKYIFLPIMTNPMCQFFLCAIALDFLSPIRYDVIRIIPSRKQPAVRGKEAGCAVFAPKL